MPRPPAVPIAIPLVLSAALLAACDGSPGGLDGGDDFTCPGPASTGCAVVEGEVAGADGQPAVGADLRVEPARSVPGVDVATTETDGEGRFRAVVLAFQEVPASVPARVVAFRRTSAPGGEIDAADTVAVSLPFAAVGERPDVVTVTLQMPE
jgi:hypothetical protein